MKQTLRYLVMLALGSSVGGALADEPIDARHLARDRSCLVCHDIDGTPPNVQAILPLAPPFRDIARRYHGDPRAAQRLATLVRQGTSPDRRHWEGKVSGNEMYPNDLEVTDAEARAIVDWILTLDTAPSKTRAAAPAH